MTQTSMAALDCACQHCGLPVSAGTRFCCAGCETVHSLLISRGLAHYYDLKNRYSFQPARPVGRVESEAFALDEIATETQANFYIEGIHCLGCLWLLEKLPEIDSRITGSDLDIAHQILSVRVSGGKIAWSEVLALLGQLGYTAKPLANDKAAEEHRHSDQRRQLWRLGLAGFSAGNVMLLAVSIYGGADSWWSRNFGWLSLALAAPALTYSAWPIYRSAFGPLLKRRISVDLAIAFAILAGVGMSIWSLVRGSAEGIYFDSLTMLVFLLLSSRYLLTRFRESLAKESACLTVLSSERYDRIGPEAGTVTAAAVLPEDKLMLTAGQTLPTDAILCAPYAHFDLSLLTGESTPVRFALGDAIDSGARLLSGRAEVKALKIASASRLAGILEQVNSFRMKRSQAVDFADRLGRYFVGVVLALAVVTLFAIPGEEGVKRALALVIVTCPCVLAFAVPLTLTRALQTAARQGIIIKDAEKLELLAAAKNLFLDKTGTVTEGAYRVLDWKNIHGQASETRFAALALENKSAHPVAKAIVRHLTLSSSPPEVTGFKEIQGYGVEGIVNGVSWKISPLPVTGDAGKNHIGIFADGELRAQVTLGDSVRADSAPAVRSLQDLGLKVMLLSGDREENVATVARALGIDAWKSRMLPEQKAEIVAQTNASVMVGDGANDAVAFQSATVGVAVQGAMELSLRHTDVVLTRPGLETLVATLKLARQTMATVRANFLITLSYNILAGALAVSGQMSPLVAAILMPSSAMSVFALTQWRTSGGKR